MKTLHKIIVRLCALYYRIGKSNIPRISVLYTITFFTMATVNIVDNTLNTLNWYDIIFIRTYPFNGIV